MVGEYQTMKPATEVMWENLVYELALKIRHLRPLVVGTTIYVPKFNRYADVSVRSLSDLLDVPWQAICHHPTYDYFTIQVNP